MWDRWRPVHTPLVVDGLELAIVVDARVYRSSDIVDMIASNPMGSRMLLGNEQGVPRRPMYTNEATFTIALRIWT